MNRTMVAASRHAGAGRSTDVATRAAPLPPAQQRFFERAFGVDFSQVRVHTGAAAGALTRTLGAKAVASGEDIAFAPGRFDPDSPSGQTLLAHELAHVAQQRHGGAASASTVEARASTAAQTAVAGGTVTPQALGGAEPGLHCDPDDDKKPVDNGPAPGRLPPSRPFSLSPGPLIDWSVPQGMFASRGMRLGLRDAKSIDMEAARIAAQLSVFGIRPNFKFNYGLGTLTYRDIINLGLQKQLEHTLGRDNPNILDQSNKEFDLAHPGAISTPILSKTWHF